MVKTQNPDGGDGQHCPVYETAVCLTLVAGMVSTSGCKDPDATSDFCSHFALPAMDQAPQKICSGNLMPYRPSFGICTGLRRSLGST